ncbi:unnamed protein product [Ixodes persulcatus]
MVTLPGSRLKLVRSMFASYIYTSTVFPNKPALSTPGVGHCACAETKCGRSEAFAHPQYTDSSATSVAYFEHVCRTGLVRPIGHTRNTSDSVCAVCILYRVWAVRYSAVLGDLIAKVTVYQRRAIFNFFGNFICAHGLKMCRFRR